MWTAELNNQVILELLNPNPFVSHLLSLSLSLSCSLSLEDSDRDADLLEADRKTNS